MGDFNVHGWFKKQYLAEDKSDKDKSDKDKVVAATNDGRIKITKGEMERLQNGEVVHLSNGSTLSFVKEGHTEDKMRPKDLEFEKAKEAERLENHPEKDKIKALQNFRRGKTDSLKEDMSSGEAVVELNYYMDKLQEISDEVKQIMRQTFPDEYNRGVAYGAFDFGSSSNKYDTTFEAILN